MARSAADRIAGDEYLYDMEIARVDAKGDAHWVETCFCDPPMAEERPYWGRYVYPLRGHKAFLELEATVL